MTPSLRRVRNTGAAVLVAALATGGCAIIQGDNGSKTLDSFVEALSNEDAGTAAQNTTDPDAAASAIQANLDGVTPADGEAVDVSAEYSMSDDGPAAINITWKLPPDAQGAPREFSTSGSATMEKVDDEWKIQWADNVLDSRLSPGVTLQYSQILDYNSRVLAADNSPLMEWIPVTIIQIPADSNSPVVDQVAEIVGQQMPEITGASIRSGMEESEDSTYTVVTLRENAIAPIREQLEAIPQVSLLADHRLVNSGFASPALSSVQPAVEERLSENAGWEVRIGDEELAGAPAKPIDDIVTTLDPSIQSAAQSAVDQTGLAASIVAIRPSTGEVVAVAQNGAANQYGAIALQGTLPPGSTFKTVTTAAALGAGTIGASDTVSCPSSVTVSGRTIPNDSDFALGTVPLRTAFADSCNTSQAIISENLPDDAMKNTAASLGLGVDFDVPGLDVDTGDVPVTEPGPARVEAAIGQGTVVTNPFGLAVMEASLQNNGTRVAPMFFKGEPATTEQQAQPLDPEVVSTLQDFQRAVVTSGTASGASNIPNLRGKTGTAETGIGPAHGWFVGAQDDLAFTVLIQEADSSKPAVSMAASFLQGL